MGEYKNQQDITGLVIERFLVSHIQHPIRCRIQMRSASSACWPAWRSLLVHDFMFLVSWD